MMLNDDWLSAMCDVLIKHEGITTWMYCDVNGYVTVGVGDLVRSPDCAAVLPFQHADGRHSTDSARREAWETVRHFYVSTRQAASYAPLTDLRLEVHFCIARLASRLRSEFVPCVVTCCPDFESFPCGAQQVLVDICYNVGIAGFAHFGRLIAACNAHNFAAAADHCHTRKDGENAADPRTWGKRNTWRRQRLIESHLAG
jgi:GH24 family phage-related lysozyme (muramidase)